MELKNNEYILWFRDWQPEENTIDKICKAFGGRRFEFYNLTLNVTKVEKGVILFLYGMRDAFELANILKQPLTYSVNEYTLENKILPQIIKTKLLTI